MHVQLEATGNVVILTFILFLSSPLSSSSPQGIITCLCKRCPIGLSTVIIII